MARNVKGAAFPSLAPLTEISQLAIGDGATLSRQAPITNATINLTLCGGCRRYSRLRLANHVPRPGGVQARVCAQCAGREISRESADGVRTDFDGLFDAPCPRTIRSGGNRRATAPAPTILTRLINYLLAKALIATYRDRSYRPFIALARIVARFGERGRP